MTDYRTTRRARHLVIPVTVRRTSEARKPPAYPINSASTGDPRNSRRARRPSGAVEFIRRVQKQDNEVRAFMRRRNQPALRQKDKVMREVRSPMVT